VEPLCLAVDIGGTKMAAALLDRAGAVRDADHVATPHSREPEVVWAGLEGLIREVVAHVPAGALRVCGVGCGGPMEQGGATVSPLNIEGWRRFPLRARVADLVGVPTAVDNDAKALALGEGWRGAAFGCDNFIAMVVSTGVGGGIVLDGRLLDGRLGNAGHIGHVIVEPDGRECSCGSFGCLEAEASGTAIAAMTGRPAAEATPEVIERTGTLVGRAVASVANLLDLDLAVVAGSVALGFGEPFFGAARVEIARRARMEFSVGTRIEPAGLGALGPLVGAGAVGWRLHDGGAIPGRAR
jgi:glucokinase